MMLCIETVHRVTNSSHLKADVAALVNGNCVYEICIETGLIS
jgi:hypothetical protein